MTPGFASGRPDLGQFLNSLQRGGLARLALSGYNTDQLDLQDAGAARREDADMPTNTIQVNRAPVLTLWATVVAERLGYAREPR